MKSELKKLIILCGLLVALGTYLWLGGREVKKIVQTIPKETATSMVNGDDSTTSSSDEVTEGDTDEEQADSDAPAGYFLVTRIIDGDTIELETGQKVRYIGVNAPESVSPTKGVECFGKAASAYNVGVVLDQYARLEKDVSETDRYKRLLRYVYLEDGTFVNLKLVEDGYAYAATFPPDVKYSAVFKTAQQEARQAGKGLWGECK